MKEFIPKDIFNESAQAYINYCKRPHTAWKLMEEPMWCLLFENGLNGYTVLDVGSGAGNSIDLLLKLGASPKKIFALEPNRELCQYLFEKYHSRGVGVMVGDSSELNVSWLQQGEFDVVTANMVVNHIPTEQYDGFVYYAYGMLKHGGELVYTSPHPDRKSIKYNWDDTDNFAVVEEPAPWGGKVKYHHRSFEYQNRLLNAAGFEEIMAIEFGYQDFMDEASLRYIELMQNKKIRGKNRMIFVAHKP